MQLGLIEMLYPVAYRRGSKKYGGEPRLIARFQTPVVPPPFVLPRPGGFPTILPAPKSPLTTASQFVGRMLAKEAPRVFGVRLIPYIGWVILLTELPLLIPIGAPSRYEEVPWFGDDEGYPTRRTGWDYTPIPVVLPNYWYDVVRVPVVWEPGAAFTRVDDPRWSNGVIHKFGYTERWDWGGSLRDGYIATQTEGIFGPVTYAVPGGQWAPSNTEPIGDPITGPENWTQRLVPGRQTWVPIGDPLDLSPVPMPIVPGYSREVFSESRPPERELDPRQRPAVVTTIRADGSVTVGTGVHELSPPKPREKEKKVKTNKRRAVFFLANLITEPLDFIEALFEALPEKYRTGYYRLHKKGGEVFYKKRRKATPQEMLRDIYQHLDEISVKDAVWNVSINHIQDRVVGGLASKVTGAAKPWYDRSGRPVGFTAGPAL